MQAYIIPYVTAIGVAGSLLILPGCAKHADFVELRDQLSTVSRSQEQDHQRVDAVLRRLESVERVKDVESGKPRVDELAARLQKLESKLAKLEDGAGLASTRADVATSDAPKATKSSKPAVQGESASIVSSMPAVSYTHLTLPTSDLV